MAPQSNVVKINAALATDIGLKRKLNEDSGIAQFPIFAIADGMGGHDSGEIASAMVVEELGKLVDPNNPRPARTKDVIEALKNAHRRVSELSATRPHGAGSTVSGVALVMRRRVPHWLVFNVGDSRVYRSLGNSLAQWTRDHSVVQLWVDQGIITPAEALTSTRSHEITKAVGAPNSKPDFFFAPVVNGERLLLCSDGLYTMMNSEAIRASLIMSGTPKTTTEGLVERAIVGGGADNITAIVIDVVSGGIPPESDADSSIVDQSMDAIAKAHAEAEDTSTIQIPRSNAVPNFEETGLEDDEAPLLAGTGIPSADSPDEVDEDTEETGPRARGRIATVAAEASFDPGASNLEDSSEDIRVAPAQETGVSFAPDAYDYDSTVVVDDSTQVVDDSTHVVDDATHVVDDATHVVDEATRVVDDSTHVVDEATRVVADEEDDTVIVDEDDIDDTTFVVSTTSEEDTVMVQRTSIDLAAIEADEEEPNEDDGVIDLIAPVDLNPAPNAPRSFIYDIDDADTNTGF